MSSEIWQVGQKMTASDMYDDVKENGFQGIRFLRAEKFAVIQLTLACAQMIAAYNEISDDQTSYLVELENGNLELENYENDVKAQIEKLIAEIKELEQKRDDGTITEEEEADLQSKRAELSSLQSGSKEHVESKTKELKNGAVERIGQHRAKMYIAKDYGETTVEKGTPLANTEVKGGFFRRLFGSTGADKKRIGENAVKTGNELLDKVSESSDLDSQIVSKLKLNKEK